MKNFQKHQLKKLKDIYLIISLLICSLSIGCNYSFYKGSLPYNNLTIDKIINETYYTGLTEKMENGINSIIPEYGNVQIIENGENILNITINSYSKIPSNYDTGGNIIAYDYSLKSLFEMNKEKQTINSRKIFSAEQLEDICQDSLINESIKIFIDKSREEM